MAETISVTCSDCTGTCLNTCSNICRSSCEGLCVSSAVSGVFGKDDDNVYNSNPAINGSAPSSCTSCTGTCMDTCGNDCEGRCSQACTDTCTGDCAGACTLSCANSCFSTCGGNCGDDCDTGCKLDCTNSCMGVCEGCTGCSNTCKNECEQQCIFSCVGQATSAENGGMLDFSNATMEEILRTLRWRKISEFPLSPTILNDDQFAVVDDQSKQEALDKLSVLLSENPSVNPLETMDLENTDMIASDYSLKTVRVTAASFVQYLSTHIKNFVLWYPTYNKENHELTWIRTVNDNQPEPVDLFELVSDIGTATHERKGLMSAEDKINLDTLMATDFATQAELDTYKIEVSDKFVQTVDDINTILRNDYVSKIALTDQYYTKGNVNDLLDTKSDKTHLHDDRYLQITQYESDIAVVNDDLDKAYNGVSLTDTNITGTQTITGEAFPQSSSVDHVTTTNTFTFTSRDGSTTSIDVPYEYYKYRMATADYGGLLSNSDYIAIHKIPDDLIEVRNDVPAIVKEKVKVGELVNDIGYLTASALPIATDTILGGIKVATDSRISLDTNGFINTKDFGASNMLKNSTFAYGDKYWTVSDASVSITGETVYGANDKCGKLIMPLNGAIVQTVSSTHGMYLTLSFDMMGSAALVITIQVGTSSVVMEESLGGATWFHFSKVIPLDNASLINEENIMLTISNSGTGASDAEFYLKNIMLQNGMYDTGWVPNPYDGNAVVGFTNPFTVDGTTIISNDGILSSPSEIDDSPLENSSAFSNTKAFSNNGVKSYIPLYIGKNPLNMTKKLRFTELYNSALGYGLVFEKTSTMFMMHATNVNDALSDSIRQKEYTTIDENGDEVTEYMDDIPFRIDLQNNTCNINGSAWSSTIAQRADYATYDASGRVIHESYVTIDEFNEVLEQLKAAIDALNDLNT